MSKNLDDCPAFPCERKERFSPIPGLPPQVADIKYSGMTLRDYFAAKAMQAIITHEAASRDVSGHAAPLCAFVAETAYRYADAMLKERNRAD